MTPLPATFSGTLLLLLLPLLLLWTGATCPADISARQGSVCTSEEVALHSAYHLTPCTYSACDSADPRTLFFLCSTSGNAPDVYTWQGLAGSCTIPEGPNYLDQPCNSTAYPVHSKVLDLSDENPARSDYCCENEIPFCQLDGSVDANNARLGHLRCGHLNFTLPTLMLNYTATSPVMNLTHLPSPVLSAGPPAFVEVTVLATGSAHLFINTVNAIPLGGVAYASYPTVSYDTEAVAPGTERVIRIEFPVSFVGEIEFQIPSVASGLPPGQYPRFYVEIVVDRAWSPLVQVPQQKPVAQFPAISFSATGFHLHWREQNSPVSSSQYYLASHNATLRHSIPRSSPAASTFPLPASFYQRFGFDAEYDGDGAVMLVTGGFHTNFADYGYSPEQEVDDVLAYLVQNDQAVPVTSGISADRTRVYHHSPRVAVGNGRWVVAWADSTDEYPGQYNFTYFATLSQADALGPNPAFSAPARLTTADQANENAVLLEYFNDGIGFMACVGAEAAQPYYGALQCGRSLDGLSFGDWQRLEVPCPLTRSSGSDDETRWGTCSLGFNALVHSALNDRRAGLTCSSSSCVLFFSVTGGVSHNLGYERTLYTAHFDVASELWQQPVQLDLGVYQAEYYPLIASASVATNRIGGDNAQWLLAVVLVSWPREATLYNARTGAAIGSGDTVFLSSSYDNGRSFGPLLPEFLELTAATNVTAPALALATDGKNWMLALQHHLLDDVGGAESHVSYSILPVETVVPPVITYPSGECILALDETCPAGTVRVGDVCESQGPCAEAAVDCAAFDSNSYCTGSPNFQCVSCGVAYTVAADYLQCDPIGECSESPDVCQEDVYARTATLGHYCDQETAWECTPCDLTQFKLAGRRTSTGGHTRCDARTAPCQDGDEFPDGSHCIDSIIYIEGGITLVPPVVVPGNPDEPPTRPEPTVTVIEGAAVVGGGVNITTNTTLSVEGTGLEVVDDFVIEGGTLNGIYLEDFSIGGDFTTSTQSTVVLTVETRTVPVVIEQCANFDGALNLTLTEQDLKNNTLTLDLFEYACHTGTFTDINIHAIGIDDLPPPDSAPPGSICTGSELHHTETYAQSFLTIVFTLDPPKCVPAPSPSPSPTAPTPGPPTTSSGTPTPTSPTTAPALSPQPATASTATPTNSAPATSTPSSTPTTTSADPGPSPASPPSPSPTQSPAPTSSNVGTIDRPTLDDSLSEVVVIVLIIFGCLVFIVLVGVAIIFLVPAVKNKVFPNRAKVKGARPLAKATSELRGSQMNARTDADDYMGNSPRADPRASVYDLHRSTSGIQKTPQSRRQLIESKNSRRLTLASGSLAQSEQVDDAPSGYGEL